MKLKTIKSEGIAHNSYFLADANEADVIDPRRDCQIYTRIAQKERTKIKYILETHRNEDYVIGSFELQNMTNAEICHSNVLPFKYGDQNLTDGDTLNIGNLKITALHTPGHTNESLRYTVNLSSQHDTLMVFTGEHCSWVQLAEQTSTAKTPNPPKPRNCTPAYTRNCCPSATTPSSTQHKAPAVSAARYQ
jgi:hydroxyacylglutathione hydrolase